MGPESVPLYCLAVMGANPARLWPLAWGTESRRRRGCTAVIDQGRWRRVRGMGSLRGSVWVRDFGQITEGIEDPPLWACGQRGWSAFPGRLIERFATRLPGQVTERIEGPPLRACCQRGWFAFPGGLIERFATRVCSQVVEGWMASHSRQAAGEWLLTSPVRPPKRLMTCLGWRREAGDSLPVRSSKGLMARRLRGGEGLPHRPQEASSSRALARVLSVI